MNYSFVCWLESRDAASFVFPYLEKIKEDPHADDIITLLNLIKTKLGGNEGMLADVLPTIKAIMPLLSPEDQDRVKRAVYSVGKSSVFQRSMIGSGYHPDTSGPATFRSLHALEDFLNQQTESEYPEIDLMIKAIKNNDRLFHALDAEFQRYVLDFIKRELEKQQNQPGIADILKKHLSNSEEND